MQPKLLPLLLLLCTASLASAQTSRRIKAVEGGLLPYVPVDGFPGWNLEARMRYHRIPGASVAVIRNFRIDWSRSYGLADTVKGTPVTGETLFSAGSISKLGLAVIALRLVERGVIALDTPVNHYLRSWKLPENERTVKQPVTLRRLLSHTAGTSQSAYFGYPADRSSLPSVVEILSGAPGTGVNPVVVNGEPGTFRYSGGGSLVAQLVLMDVTGKDFTTLAEEELFRPLGMRRSTFAQPLPAHRAANASWGYSSASWYTGTPYLYPQQGAAGLYTTATDLALLIIELQKGYAGKSRFLSQATVRAMMTPQAAVSEGAYKESVGIGTFLLERRDNEGEDGRYFEHQGVNAGFMSWAIGSLTGGNGVVILHNSGDDFNGFGTELRRSVAQAYRWTRFLPPPVVPMPLSRADLDLYAGRYRKGPDEVLTLRREGNYLVENINGGKDIYCFPIARDTIVFTDYNVQGYFTRNGSGIGSLRNEYQDSLSAMPRMREGEWTPSEHLAAGRYAEAKEGYRQLRYDVSRLTYMAYERIRSRPADLPAARALLELAEAQYSAESIVYSRWGDYFEAVGNRAEALRSYRKALSLEPGNEEVRKRVEALER